ALAVGCALLLLVLISASVLVTNRLLRTGWGDAAADLGPERNTEDEPRRLSAAARAIRPAMLRLDRAWREHAARSEAHVAAAEAVIAAAPEPLILIDHERRIVR